MAFHPSAKVLQDYGQGKLDDAAAATVSYHLERCPECLQTVANLSGDSFLDQVRDARFATVTPGAASSDPGLPPELRDHPQYEIMRELGRGGMGVVYLARHRLTKRHEVLKLVSARLLDEPGATERFLREMESIAKLDHPNIVKAHSAFQAGKLLVLAMEYVDGATLAQTVHKEGPLPIANACLYACQVARGLQHAFERGMIHRDIKPQNLMLTRDGKRHGVKILDFGLAKPAQATERSRRGLTRTGYTLGTPHYMAPEQIEDAGKVDIRADLYSLGCTLYFLLSGRPPFDGNSDIKLFDAHRRSLPKPMQSIRPDVPADLAAVVAKLLQKDPGSRYQTPGEAAKALEPFFKTTSTPAPPPTGKPNTAPDTWVQPQPLPPTRMEGKQTVARATEAIAHTAARPRGSGGRCSSWLAADLHAGAPMDLPQAAPGAGSQHASRRREGRQ
jgi:serine/threonine protein kinase